MLLESSAVLSSLLAFAAYLLGLSVLVQVLQEGYKFLTSSKARAYRRVLHDLLGPLWSQVERAQGAVSLQARGPFQLFRLRPQGRLLPLDSQALSTLLERSAPTWVQRGLAQLRDEVAVQATNKDAWSHGWTTFLKELADAPKGSAGYWTAEDIRRFLEKNGHGTETTVSNSPRLAAEQLLQRFRANFLPAVVTVERTFPQLETNFEYTYRRRNLRQSFLIGLLVTAALSFPVDTIWRASTRLSPAEALALADQAQEAAARARPAQSPGHAQPEPTTTLPPTDDDCDRLADALEALNDSLNLLATTSARPESPGLELFAGLRTTWQEQGFWATILHLLSCAFTAVLLSFGAPFWNDAVGALSTLQRKPPRSGGSE